MLQRRTNEPNKLVDKTVNCCCKSVILCSVVDTWNCWESSQDIVRFFSLQSSKDGELQQPRLVRRLLPKLEQRCMVLLVPKGKKSVTARPRVKAGLMWLPKHYKHQGRDHKPPYRPTAITSQPLWWPFVPLSSTLATAPFPKIIKMAVQKFSGIFDCPCKIHW